MYTGIDTAVPLTAEQCASIKRAGYLWSGRYLVPPNSYRKALTLEEAKRITDAGLKILTVYETTPGVAADAAAVGAEINRLDAAIEALQALVANL